MTSEPVRWGLLSTARINERLIPAIRQTERTEVMAVASRDAERASRYAAKWGIPRAYGSYRDLLQDPEIDAVYLPLPNSEHAEWTVRSAAAGKHVLCEKPMALTPEDVDRMAAAARAQEVVVQEAAMFRFHPQTREVRDLVAGGAIGQLRAIQCNFGFTLSHVGDIRLEPALGGGALWDIGSYPVSFSRTMVGAGPVAVAGWQVPSETGVDLSFGGQMRFRDGPVAQFCCSFAALTNWGARLIGSQGLIELDLPFQNQVGATARVRLARGGPAATATFGDGTDHLQVETVTYENCNAYQCQVEAMVASILDGTEPTIELADSRANVATLVGLYTAAREHTVVQLEERGQ